MECVALVSGGRWVLTRSISADTWAREPKDCNILHPALSFRNMPRGLSPGSQWGLTQGPGVPWDRGSPSPARGTCTAKQPGS